MKNNSLTEIASILKKSDSVILYPHTSMDGDTLGSCAALCRALRTSGKTACILIEDDIPDYLFFLDNNYCTQDLDAIKNPDVCMCVDCGDIGRFPVRKDKFLEGATTVCVDHHRTTKNFADYNYIDPEAAATGQIIYELIIQMGMTPDKEMAEAIFAAITTDTGNFQYSNTTAETHRITAQLYASGMDHNKISVQLYENMRREKLEISNRALSTMCFFAKGRGVIAYVDRNMLEKTGANMSETEGIVESLRNIKGVEVAVFLKENNKGCIKVSMRAKTRGDVSVIASKYNGGGHTKAAGFTLKGKTIEEGRTLLKREVEDILGNDD